MVMRPSYVSVGAQLYTGVGATGLEEYDKLFPICRGQTEGHICSCPARGGYIEHGQR